MESEIVATVDTIAAGSQFTDSEYNPAVAPYLYLSYSTFDGETTNKLFVLDPTQNFEDVISIDLSTSSETLREISLSAAGDLYIGQFGAPVDILVDADEVDFDDNSSLDWYAPNGGSNFSGIDVAVGLPVMTPGVSCDFDGDELCNTVDIDLLTGEIIAGTNNLNAYILSVRMYGGDLVNSVYQFEKIGRGVAVDVWVARVGGMEVVLCVGLPCEMTGTADQ